jgi:hypothetical protein
MEAFVVTHETQPNHNSSGKKKAHVVFVVAVKEQDRVWQVARRFSEFVALADKLDNIPRLPSKLTIGRLDYGQRAERAVNLSSWLKQVVKSCQNSPLLQKFLEVNARPRLL